MKCLIPVSLNIDRLVLAHPPQNVKRFNRDYLTYIVHLLTAIPAIDNGRTLKNGFVPIKASTLQVKIRNYKSYLKYLMDSGVVVSDTHYMPGTKCIGYKFTTFYSGRVHGGELKDKRIAKKLFKSKPIATTIQKKYGHLLKWFNSGLQIHYNMALDFIKRDLEKKLHNPDLRDRDHRTGVYKNPWMQYNSALLNIEKIAVDLNHISVDSKGFRLHSVLSNLRSPLRNCLTYNGLQLISIDINNCQPYLITLLLTSSFWVKKDFTNTLYCDILPISVNGIFDSECLSSFIMLVKNFEMQAVSDFQVYTQLVKSGQFYEHMATIIQNELGDGYLDRKTIKAIVFQVLFTDNRFIGQEEALPKRIFQRLFPNVYQVLSMIKRKDKRILPILLQQIESHLILQVITKRIAKERPKTPLFTIHDSIVTTEGNELYVQGVILNEMEKAVGFGPQLRIERWAPENLRSGDGTSFLQTGKAAA